MRKLLLTLPLLALAAAQPAYAVGLATGTSISTGGSVIASPTNQDISQATSLDFILTDGTNTPSPGVPGQLTFYGTGTGSFAGLFCITGTCGTIKDIASLTPGAQTINSFVILTGGNNVNPITFDLLGISSITRSVAGSLVFSANGNINYAGFDATPGVFQFTAQGNTITSFSASIQAVPEPATWGMMLLGFAGIGMAVRRRRRPALAQLA